MYILEIIKVFKTVSIGTLFNVSYKTANYL